MGSARSLGKRDLPDLLAGGLMVAIGALGLWAGRDLTIGSPAIMGPGFMPMVMCGLLILIGAFVFAKGLGKPASAIDALNLRPLSILVVAIAGFAFAAQAFGFVVATVWLLIVGSLADEESRWREIAISTAILTVVGAFVFIRALGVQMPIWPF